MILLCTFSIANYTPKNIRAFIRFVKFLFFEVALYPINLLYSLVWNAAVMSGLVLLVATWIY